MSSRLPTQLCGVVFGVAVLSLGCGGESSLSPASVHRVFGGQSVFLAALDGWERPGQCGVEPALIPSLGCPSAPTLDAETIENLERRFEHALLAPAGDALSIETLHGAALLRLVTQPEDARALDDALGYLAEALRRPVDNEHRAKLLNDRAVALLFQAAVTQSPIEVAASLESSLEALELDGSNAAARFNQRLAQVLLGVDSEEQVADEPALAALARKLRVVESPGLPEGCWRPEAVIEALDSWAESPGPETWAPLESQRACVAEVEDRFLHDLLTAAVEDGEGLAAEWRLYREADAALRAGDRSAVQEGLANLRARDPHSAVWIAAAWNDAILELQQGRPSDARTALESQRAQAEARNYLGLTAKNLHNLSLLANIRKDYAAALALNRAAETAAQRAGASTLSAAIRSQRTELEKLGGREVDAWVSKVESMRRLDPEGQAEALVGALSYFADLAQAQDFERVSLLLRNRAVEVAKDVGPMFHITMLRGRGMLLAQIGRLTEARDDLEQARKLLDESGGDLVAAQNLRIALDHLEGLVSEDLTHRRTLLAASLTHYREIHYDYRILEVQHALAQAQREDGDTEASRITLEEAIVELTEQVDKVVTWQDATALVTAARPVVDSLIELQLEQGDTQAVRQTLGRFLGLRSRPAEGVPAVERLATARWTLFVREHEVLLLFEPGLGATAEGPITLVRQPVERRLLAELRQQVQRRARAQSQRFDHELHQLADLLVTPLREHLEAAQEAQPLIVVTDDVLAGIPVHLLPVGDGERLIDHWVVRYATDLRAPRIRSIPSRILAVGADGRGSGLGTLASAESEARTAASFYGSYQVLLGNIATPNQVLSGSTETKEPIDGVHVSSHFEINSRAPLESALVLNPPPDSTQSSTADLDRRLTLRQLLDAVPADLDLLYLSACDTGLGLSGGSHGLHSLAQAFSASGVGRSVLTLWPIDDTIAADLAERFHALHAQGVPAAEALRRAQLEFRDQHPASWGALVVVQ